MLSKISVIVTIVSEMLENKALNEFLYWEDPYRGPTCIRVPHEVSSVNRVMHSPKKSIKNRQNKPYLYTNYPFLTKIL